MPNDNKNNTSDNEEENELEELLDLAEQGDSKAQSDLFELAQKGDSKSQIYLAHYYYKTDLDNKREAILELLELAANQGNADAMNILGEFLYEIDRLDKAELWFKEAAKHNHKEALRNLGLHYHDNGNNLEEIFKLLHEAVENQSEETSFYIESINYDIWKESNGLDQDSTLEFIIEVANSNNPAGQYQLANFYIDINPEQKEEEIIQLLIPFP